MRQVLPHPLWIGHAGDLAQPRLFREHAIDVIVDLAINEPVAQVAREQVYLRIPLHDGAGNDRADLRLAVHAVSEALASGRRICVCCSNGMSRSVCIAAMGLSVHTGTKAAECLQELTRGGGDVAPDLWDALLRAMETNRPGVE